MFEYFYNESIRKLVVAFGSIFNDIYVERLNGDGSQNSKIRVPIGYGSKEKFIRRLEEQSGISDETKVEITLPRMGFEIASIDYDPTRHLNKINKRFKRVEGEPILDSFQEVPYNIGFSLYAYTRTMDDNLQIVEQILPYFSPEFIVTLKMNDIDMSLDVPITLTNATVQETYDGNFLDRRILASSFSFTCKTRLYSKINESSVIVRSTATMNEILANEDLSDIIRTISVTGDVDTLAKGKIIYE